MISDRWLRVLAPIFLSLLIFVSACAPKQTSRYSDIQKETTRRGAPSAVVKTAEQGGTFNKFFPGSMGSYEVVPAQEKKGFAEYKINQDGKTVAMLTINDTLSLPSAAAKYKTSTEKVAGYPAVDQGTTATGILVNDRYQVKVLSRDASFTREDRVAWLQKFDLKGLAKLESAPASTTATTSKPSKAADSTPTLPRSSRTADSKPKLEFPPGLSPQPAT
ncbi:hypothetical protein [Thermocoleostomius sinensis]|jgi:hypothetical protein|uniref:Uncharacterized protein n=1 Tax=Thermocoleostomius sinensis A174 TaxID=2016057 RepID=A0A9E9CBY1_9CYAN|nr:hypothetical protein [Thermocoleostomius sinensis]WAL61460.1 hypothetical protein OXH18_05570 [Thermocoleostomius sinensis A174]